MARFRGRCGDVRSAGALQPAEIMWMGAWLFATHGFARRYGASLSCHLIPLSIQTV